MPNRLASESSPYLQQHADNPVDWYPWGDEAFERARAEDRPVLLSVGYSACHWCHVMAHESFEDDATAAVMNERFVNVKVDREERPDVDSIYMTAVQSMTGHGGWPMTVFLTPEGEPFYGGTYYPPEPRHGLPSFREVLLGVDRAYRERKQEVRGSAERLRSALEDNARLAAPTDGLDDEVLDRAARRIAEQYDPEHGGFGSAPKFPQPMVLDCLLRHHRRTGDPHALEVVTHTLRRMARGGMYDQVGGGFHRYSVDARWLVPHFEKMLYDNALLARLYVHAHQVTGEAEFRRVAEETLDYVAREMTAPEGAFYSAQDADSEGVEGKFYVWSPAEIDAAVGPEDGRLLRRYWGVTESGNFEGRSILHVPGDPAEVAADAGVEPDALAAVVARGREALYEARRARVPPARDEKVLTSWNAMMLQAFAVAARVLDRPDYGAIATRAAEFLLDALRPGGRLRRSWRDGEARIEGFLEDHALLAEALLSLYELTGEARWVRTARELGDEVLDRFQDQDGVFYDAASDARETVVRARSVDDNATPSGGSAATLLLLRLTAFTGERRYEDAALDTLHRMGGLLKRAPMAFGYLLTALDFHLAAPREIVIVGDPAAAGTRALLDVVRESYRPNAVVALRRPDDDPVVERTVPLLAGRALLDGRPAAYVCRRFTCRRPVAEPEALRQELGEEPHAGS